MTDRRDTGNPEYVPVGHLSPSIAAPEDHTPMLRSLLLLVVCGYAAAEESLPTLDDVLAILEAERPKELTHEEKLTQFYKEYNPTKMGDIPQLRLIPPAVLLRFLISLPLRQVRDAGSVHLRPCGPVGRMCPGPTPWLLVVMLVVLGVDPAFVIVAATVDSSSPAVVPAATVVVAPGV